MELLFLSKRGVVGESPRGHESVVPRWQLEGSSREKTAEGCGVSGRCTVERGGKHWGGGGEPQEKRLGVESDKGKQIPCKRQN